MQNCAATPTPMTITNNLSKSSGELLVDLVPYRSTLGDLQCLTQTRQDVIFVVNKLSQFP